MARERAEAAKLHLSDARSELARVGDILDKANSLMEQRRAEVAPLLAELLVQAESAYQSMIDVGEKEREEYGYRMHLMQVRQEMELVRAEFNAICGQPSS